MHEFIAMTSAQLPTGMLDLAISNGSDLLNLKPDFSSMLHYAIMYDNDDYAFFVMRRFPEALNIRNHCGFTPLMEAIMYHNEPVALELIRLGAEVGVLDSWGFSDLWLAVTKNLLDVVREMLSQWDGSLQNDAMDAFETAVSLKSVGAIELLLEHPAYKTAENIRGAVHAMTVWPGDNGKQLAQTLRARYPELFL
ncbi:ankyrin repeat-containing domain protein [Aspergillus ambiguus]|uniref:ankyrin repeat domain-containing protein n=1 Tax=Aspergillus ambiguus TaxID=176160 RepID=UPI003CCCAB22